MKLNKIIFKEYDIRGKYPEELSPEAAYRIVTAFFIAKKIKRLIVARDLRPESKWVLLQIKKAAAASGVVVADLGTQSTPALFFALGGGCYDAGIMITASHSPKGIAGLKFCLRDGRAVSGLELKRLVGKLSDKKVGQKKKLSVRGAVAKNNPLAGYAKFALSFINKKKLKKCKIIMDASGGSGAQLAQTVFGSLPVQVVKMNFLAGDRYPDHGLNPLLLENQKSIISEVKKRGADLGVIFDGDADRAVLIDEIGQPANPYHLNCLLCRIALEKLKIKKIAIDGRLELGIKETIARGGGRAVVCRSGWANFVDLMVQERIAFGCENSGHFFVNLSLKQKKNYAYGDAIIPILLLLEYLAENDLSLAEALREYRQKYHLSGEINLTGIDFRKAAAKVAAKFRRYQQNKRDGLSVSGPDWFINLRPSHTEPLVRLNIEAKSKAVLRKLKKELLMLAR